MQPRLYTPGMIHAACVQYTYTTTTVPKPSHPALSLNPCGAGCELDGPRPPLCPTPGRPPAYPTATASPAVPHAHSTAAGAPRGASQHVGRSAAPRELPPLPVHKGACRGAAAAGSARSAQQLLHMREQLGVVAPEQHARLHAALGRPSRALSDEAGQRVAGAREHRVAGAQDERRAEVVGAVARVHDARVRAAPPQRLQLLPLRGRASCSGTVNTASPRHDVRDCQSPAGRASYGSVHPTKKFKAHHLQPPFQRLQTLVLPARQCPRV